MNTIQYNTIQWIDTTKCWGVVGQRKLTCVATGKINMSKVSPQLG